MYGNYSSGAGSAAGDSIGLMFIGCWGFFIVIGLLLLALNIWMLIDAIGRQEYEYPGSTGNSKNLWVILMAVGIVMSFGWLVAIIYYFKVFRVIRRGSIAPPQWAQQPGAPQPYAQPGQPYAQPAPPAYAPPAPPAYAPPVYAPPAPPAPPMYAPPAAPEPQEPTAPAAPEEPQAPPAPPTPPGE